MLRTITIAGSLLLALAAAQADTTRPSLKPAATVTGDVVLIGDLVEHAGKLANVAVFRAPDLGTTGTVATTLVREALRPHGLADLDTGNLTEVIVSRPSRAITVQEIESRILRSLAKHKLSTVDDLKLNIDQALRTIHVEADATAELEIVHMSMDAYGSRFSVVLNVPGSAILRRTPLRLTGRVAETAEAVVVTRSLRRGEIVRRGDITIERRPRAAVGRDDVGQLETAAGLAVRRPLRAGHVLRHADLMKPELVHRDEAVVLVYQIPSVMLTIRGKALEAGAEGDVISVLNLQSKRTIQGTVTGPGQVTVTGTIARIVPAKTASLQPTSTPTRPE